ncbi:MAG: glycosyltransferase [Ruminiclostridium sp.]
MAKILYCASVASHIENFHKPYIAEYKRRGFEVHTCTYGKADCADVDKTFDLPFIKKVYSPKNVITILKLAKIIRSEKYDYIMTQASLAGIIGRAAALLSFRKPKIIHTCHGYLFNDDGGKKAMFMILCEKLFRKRTDVLAVMNKDDMAIAEKYRLGKSIRFLDGMGVDNSIFPPIPKEESLKTKVDMGIEKDEFVFINVAEFSARKNQQLIIHAFAKMKNKATLILAGEGETLQSCMELAKALGVDERVIFVHHSCNINALLRLSDCFVSSSRFEGLPFCVMEALYCGLPVIASDVKGHKDLIGESNGLLYPSDNADALAEAMDSFLSDKALCTEKSGKGLDEKYLIGSCLKKNTELFGI